MFYYSSYTRQIQIAALHNTFQGQIKGFCMAIHLRYTALLLVYVIAWVAVVFGINCASNVGRKLVIVRGAALLLFPTYITRAINSKYYGKPCYYKLIQHVLSEPCYR